VFVSFFVQKLRLGAHPLVVMRENCERSKGLPQAYLKLPLEEVRKHVKQDLTSWSDKKLNPKVRTCAISACLVGGLLPMLLLNAMSRWLF